MNVQNNDSEVTTTRQSGIHDITSITTEASIVEHILFFFFLVFGWEKVIGLSPTRPTICASPGPYVFPSVHVCI